MARAVMQPGPDISLPQRGEVWSIAVSLRLPTIEANDRASLVCELLFIEHLFNMTQKPPAMVQADQALELLIEYQRDLFTPQIVEEMDAYLKKLERRGRTRKVLLQAHGEVVETIEQLSRLTTSFPANTFFRTVPDSLRCAALERFQYFEISLRSHGTGPWPFPGLSEFLRHGLIALWNEKQALSSKFRQN